MMMVYFRSNLTNELHSLSNNEIWELLTVDWERKILVANRNGADIQLQILEHESPGLKLICTELGLKAGHLNRSSSC